MMLSTSCLDKEPTHAILADQAITNVTEANQAVLGILILHYFPIFRLIWFML